MAFTPWQKHLVVEGHCTVCGRAIPKAAVVQGVAYSHGQSWHTDPQGAIVPCTAKPI
jgi:hypothetical protein